MKKMVSSSPTESVVNIIIIINSVIKWKIEKMGFFKIKYLDEDKITFFKLTFFQNNFFFKITFFQNNFFSKYLFSKYLFSKYLFLNIIFSK